MTDRRVAVILPSAGRPAVLAEVIDDLRRQTFADFALVVSVPSVTDLPEAPLPPGTVVVHAHGAAAQRNAAIDAVAGATHVFCFDDDAVVRADYLERALEFFSAHPSVVGLTGRVLLDGARLPDEVSRPDAERALAASSERLGSWRPVGELYGCNFAFRPVAGVRFDERLPLYSWLEDRDFALRMRRFGALAEVDDCVVVHRGVKSGGRMAHERYGYSQVMNPAYLHRVGSFPLRLALRLTLPVVARNLIASLGGADRPWRRERLRGNLLALGDIVRRRFTPERILELPGPAIR